MTKFSFRGASLAVVALLLNALIASDECATVSETRRAKEARADLYSQFVSSSRSQSKRKTDKVHGARKATVRDAGYDWSDTEQSEISDDVFNCLQESENLLTVQKANSKDRNKNGGVQSRDVSRAATKESSRDRQRLPGRRSLKSGKSAKGTKRTTELAKARKLLERPSWAYQPEDALGPPMDAGTSSSTSSAADSDDESSTESSSISEPSTRGERQLTVGLDGRVNWSGQTDMSDSDDDAVVMPAEEEGAKLVAQAERRALHAHETAKRAPRLAAALGNTTRHSPNHLIDSIVGDGVLELQPKEITAGPQPSLQSSSTALVLDAAGSMASEFQKDTEFFASIPYRRASGTPSFVERRRSQLLQSWLTDGLLPPGTDTLQVTLPRGTDTVQEVGGMLGLKGAATFNAEQARLQMGEPAHGSGGVLGDPSQGASGLGPMTAENVLALPPPDLSLLAPDDPDLNMPQLFADEAELDGRERELVLVTRKTTLRSSTDPNFERQEETQVVVPRWAAERFGDDEAREEASLAAWGGGRAGSKKMMLHEKDAAGNTVMDLKEGTSSRQLVVPRPQRKSPAERRIENLTAVYTEQARQDSKLTAKQYVEKYREEVHEMAAVTFKDSRRDVHLIEQTARKVGAKPRGARVSSKDGKQALQSMSHVPRNRVMPLKDLFRMRRKLQADYDKAKADAHAKGMDLTPALVKARDALRYSGGTRNDVIAKGARFGKVAEWRELKKRRDKRRGVRRGPHGLMNRPS